MAIDLTGLPYGAGHMIKETLGHEGVTPDHVLLMADALERVQSHLPSSSHYRPHCTRVIAQLRDIAANYAKPPAEAAQIND